jgi:hypothetical protein
MISVDHPDVDTDDSFPLVAGRFKVWQSLSRFAMSGQASRRRSSYADKGWLHGAFYFVTKRQSLAEIAKVLIGNRGPVHCSELAILERLLPAWRTYAFENTRGIVFVLAMSTNSGKSLSALHNGAHVLRRCVSSAIHYRHSVCGQTDRR